MTDRILVTGATGTIGSALVTALAGQDDAAVTAFVRDPGKADALKAAGAGIAAGTFEDAASLDDAMREIDTVVLIAPPNAGCVEQNAAVIDAAGRSGVAKIVRISAIKAAEDGRTENTRLHGQCDRMLESSGLAWVILRPNYFMQNFLLSLDTIRTDGNVYAGMGDGRLAMIDARDVAAAAARCATTDAFDYRAFELSGPSSINFAEAAAVLTMVLGRTVNYVPISPGDVEASLIGLGFDPWMAALLREYSQAYSEDWGDLVTDSVETITGRVPRSFRDFAAEVLKPLLD